MNSTANWGTTAELMDPEISTSKFLAALLRLNWIPHDQLGRPPRPCSARRFADGSNYREP